MTDKTSLYAWTRIVHFTFFLVHIKWLSIYGKGIQGHLICLTDDIYVLRLVSGVFLFIILKKDENKEFQSQYLCKASFICLSLVYYIKKKWQWLEHIKSVLMHMDACFNVRPCHA